ncbi:MAG: hypothetical protein AB2L20_12035 [Mangrovibacterium sp.]
MTTNSRGLRNNNPGNIRKNSDKFRGEVLPSKDKSFKQFTSMAFGYRAIFVIMRNYKTKYGLSTIKDWITRWAPNTENDTASYIRSVSQFSSVGPDGVININDKNMMCRIVAAMSRVENGIPAVMTDVQAGYDLI